ncbi:MAG: ATP-binding protein, partial [Rubrivivax sp.]|nr:ATP-binding protein [Rubrivivax sp.]
WLLRGTTGSGRRTLAGALARAAGRGLVAAAEPDALASLGAASALLDALPLATFDPAPGESIAWAPPPGLPASLFVRMPRHGGLTIDGRTSRRVDLDPPDADERRRHWALAWPGRAVDEALVGWRLPRGRLHRAAQAVPFGTPDALAAVADEIGALGRHALDGIARRVPAAGVDEPLALAGTAGEEFDALVARCRHRDRLALHLPAALAASCGVRALFKGPSGTGKTLAARHLAARLGRPLYRVDLAATVSKYVGETERNLERVFDAAESLDIVLLLDEGDALLAGRTGVQSSTDRYANLETNYLLQRLEAYAGVLLVTTNAAERIDGAFARRLDVTIEFALPDAATRLALWTSHLGTGHAVSAEALERIARRCAIPGGQIRNAALHAALLAIDRDRAIDEGLLAQALEREYRKAGQQCPSLGG